MTSRNLRLRESVFTPFLRRWFTNERTREQAELLALYHEVRGEYRFHADIPRALVRAVLDRVHPQLPYATNLRDAIGECYCDLIALEESIFPPEEIDWRTASLSLREAAELRNSLRQKQHFLANEAKCTEYLTDVISIVITGLLGDLPELTNKRSLFSVPLVHLFHNPADVIERIFGTFDEQEYIDAGLFHKFRRRFYENLCAASGLVPDQEHRKPYTWPSKQKLSPTELTDTYLAGTPFHKLFHVQVPLAVTSEAMFSHMHVVGGSGAGKTQWLSQLILHHLDDPERPAVVVVDSQGDLISKLARLEALDERAILISPKDIKHPPAINVFDMKQGRLGRYDEVTREQVVAGAIQTFDYLFSGLLGADLTFKQRTFFVYVCRLLLTLPDTMGRNATILDMIDLMDDPSPYQEAIGRLPTIQRRFFERDFHQKNFQQTKEQIRYRLSGTLENPTLERLFTAPVTKLDLFNELNSGSVILVDTAKDFLKGASGHFGRLFISLVLQAILERAAIHESERKPAFLIVDEAAEYFDQNIDDLLTEARKYKLGCVLAHQFMEQATPGLRASLAANTSIKMASGISVSDARGLAPDLRTTPEFILSQPKLHFACYIRGVTSHAISVPVEAGTLERQPKMSPEEYEAFRERNRERVSAPGTPEEPCEPSEADAQHTPASPDDDDFDDRAATWTP